MSDEPSDINAAAAEALAQIKSVLESAKNELAVAKGAIEEIQRTTKADADTITKTKQDIDTLKSDAITASAELKTSQKDLEKTLGELDKKRETLESVVEQISALKVKGEAEQKGVEDSVKAISDFKSQFDTLSKETQSKHEELGEKHAGVDNQINEIAKANDAVKQIYGALFTDTPEKKCMKTAITELQKQISDAFTEAKEKNLETARAFEKLRDELKERILTLLPSAGAAGLASTYYDAKSRYAVTAFHSYSEDPKDRGSYFQRALAHNPGSFVATIFFYALFLGPIAIIIWLFYDLLQKITTMAPGALSDRYLLFRTLIAVPLGTVSLFGYSSLRLYRRLYEEYNYKQRVMELYTSFSKEVEEKGDEDQRKALIAIMLKAVADKPTLGMHRYDGMGQGGGIKIDLAQFINRLFGPSKPTS